MHLKSTSIKSRNKKSSHGSSHHVSHLHHHFPEWLSVLVAIFLGLIIVAGIKILFSVSLKTPGKGYEMGMGFPSPPQAPFGGLGEMGYPSGAQPSQEPFPGMPSEPHPTGMPTSQPPALTAEMCNSLQDPIAVRTCWDCVNNPASCDFTPTPIEQDPAQAYCDVNKNAQPDTCGNCILDGREGRGEECEPHGFILGYYIAGAKWEVEGKGLPRLCLPKGTKNANWEERGCYWARCGDGVLTLEGSNLKEECDDGNTIDTDECSNSCKKPKKCGTGRGEICEGDSKNSCEVPGSFKKEDIKDYWLDSGLIGDCRPKIKLVDTGGDGIADSLEEEQKHCFCEKKICCLCLYQKTPPISCDRVGGSFFDSEFIESMCNNVEGCTWDPQKKSCTGKFICSGAKDKNLCNMGGLAIFFGPNYCKWDDKSSSCKDLFEYECRGWVNNKEQMNCDTQPIQIIQENQFISAPSAELTYFSGENCFEERIIRQGHSNPERCEEAFEQVTKCLTLSPSIKTLLFKDDGCSTAENRKKAEEEARKLSEEIAVLVAEGKLSPDVAVTVTINQGTSSFGETCNSFVSYYISAEGYGMQPHRCHPVGSECMDFNAEGGESPPRDCIDESGNAANQICCGQRRVIGLTAKAGNWQRGNSCQ